MKPKCASVYDRSGLWVVETWSWWGGMLTIDGIAHVSDGLPDDAALGLAVLTALDDSGEIPEDLYGASGDPPWKQRQDRGDRAAQSIGFKSTRDFTKGAQLVHVEMYEDRIELDPMRNLGPSKGFEGMGEERKRVLIEYDATQLGAAIREAIQVAV